MPTNPAIDDRLIEEAKKLGKHRTKKEAVTAALNEYVQRHRQQAIVRLFGSIEYDEEYHQARTRAEAAMRMLVDTSRVAPQQGEFRRKGARAD